MKIKKPFNKYTWINSFKETNYFKLSQTYLFTDKTLQKLLKHFNIIKPINKTYLLKSRSGLRLGRGSSKIIGKRFYVLKDSKLTIKK